MLSRDENTKSQRMKVMLQMFVCDKVVEATATGFLGKVSLVTCRPIGGGVGAEQASICPII